MEFVYSLIKSLFLIFMLLVIAPTVLFLTKSYYSHFVSKKTYVGIIDLPQILTNGSDVVSSVKNLFSSPEIRALVLICNSKGGNPGSCLSAHLDILRLKELYQKPVFAFIEKECFSGAYIIATAADYIISSPAALIGNICEFDVENEKGTTEEFSSKIIENFTQQYLNIIKKFRPNIDGSFIFNLENSFITGLQAKDQGFVDNCGGRMEIEKIIRNKTVIEGKLEEIRGSLGEHFIFYISNAVHRIINGINK